MEILAARGLTFRYPGEDVPALDDVTLTVNAGDFAVVCGYSGCGKSTLLRQFKPALTPKGEASGEVRLFGEPASRLSGRDAAARIGFLSQSPENMTVTDKVWRELVFGAESLGLPPAEIRRRAAEVSAFFGLDALFYRDTSELSGGQLTLLSLASVMMLRPDAVLLDEPSARLDPVASGNVFAYLTKINRELGTTVLVADHRLEELFPLASRAVVMDAGRVIFDGSPREAAGYLRGARHGMYAALPAAARIASALSGELGEKKTAPPFADGNLTAENPAFSLLGGEAGASTADGFAGGMPAAARISSAPRGEKSAAPGDESARSAEGKDTAGTPVSGSSTGGMPAAAGEIAELPASAVPGMFTSGGTAAGDPATGDTTGGVSADARISSAPRSEKSAAPGDESARSPEGKDTAGTSASGGSAGGMPAAVDPATPSANVTAGESTPLSVAEGRVFLRDFAARHPHRAGDGSAGGSRLPVEGRTPLAERRAPLVDRGTPSAAGGEFGDRTPLAGGQPSSVALQSGGEQTPPAGGQSADRPLFAEGQLGNQNLLAKEQIFPAAPQPGGDRRSPKGGQSGEQAMPADGRAPLVDKGVPSGTGGQSGNRTTLAVGGRFGEQASTATEGQFAEQTFPTTGGDLPAAPQPGGGRRSPNEGQSGEQAMPAEGRTPLAVGEQPADPTPSAGGRTPLTTGGQSGNQSSPIAGGMPGEQIAPAVARQPGDQTPPTEGEIPSATGQFLDQSPPVAEGMFGEQTPSGTGGQSADRLPFAEGQLGNQSLPAKELTFPAAPQPGGDRRSPNGGQPGNQFSLIAGGMPGEQIALAVAGQPGERTPPTEGETPPAMVRPSVESQPSSVALQSGGEQTPLAGGQSADRPPFAGGQLGNQSLLAKEQIFPAAPQPGGGRRSPNGGQPGEQAMPAEGRTPFAVGEQPCDQISPTEGEIPSAMVRPSVESQPSSVALQPGGEQTPLAGGQFADRPPFAEGQLGNQNLLAKGQAFPAVPQSGGNRRSPNGGQSGEQAMPAEGRTQFAVGEQPADPTPSAGGRTPLTTGGQSGNHSSPAVGGTSGEQIALAVAGQSGDQTPPTEGETPPATGQFLDQSLPVAEGMFGEQTPSGTGGQSADQPSPAARPSGASGDRPAGDAVLTARGVRFRYGKDLPDVLRGLDFTARRGEICALLGGNGCGKTTALRVFSGALKPYAGGVSLRGKVGFMPQEPETLFAKDTLAEELSACGKGGDAVARVAGVCRLEGLLSRHPYDLSGGEVRRAALAKLLLYEPDILLLDEPTAGMDARFCREFAGILRGVCGRGAAVVLVSHDTEFCAKYASRCVMLFSGEAVCDETPREFFAENRFYTTSAARIAEGIVPGAVTDSDITGAFGVAPPESAEQEPPSPAVSVRVPPRRKMPLWRKIGAAVSAAGAFAVMLYASRKGALAGAVGVSGITAKGRRLFGVYGVFFAFLLASACFLFEKKSSSEWGNPPRRPSGKSLAVAVLCFAAVPVTLMLGFRFWGRSHYLILSFAVLLECLVPFFALFEGRRPGAGRLAVTATLTALAVGGRAMFFMLPEFKPVLAVTVISGAALGGETGFLVGAVSMLVSNVLFSEGPWTPWQMFAMGLCGLAAGLLFYNANLRRTRAVYAVAGAALALLLYGPVMNLASALMMSGEALTGKLVLTYMLTGFPVDCVHAASSAIFLWFLGEPLTEKLERVRVKYGL